VFPSTRAGEHARWFWEVFFAGTTTASEHELTRHLTSAFAANFLPEAEGLSSVADTRRPLRGSHAVSVEERRAEDLSVVRYRTPKGLHLELHLKHEVSDNDRISGFGNRLPGGGSTTAIEMAAARAAHASVDGGWLLDDRIAAELGGEVADRRVAITAASPHRQDNRLMICARSRLAEDVALKTHYGGTRQYLVLGAGLDSFAVRFRDRTDIHVFEVDSLASQRWKRERLASIGVSTPPNLTWIESDLADPRLRARLAESGFKFDRPFTVSMIGVSYYLEVGVLASLLESIVPRRSEAHLVLDYLVHPSTWVDLSASMARRMERRRREAALSGEPWLSFHSEHSAEELLSSKGLRVDEDLGCADLVARFAPDRELPVQPEPFMRVVRATSAS
jgi:methyltransferase (TIGR00027 family)